MLTVEVDVRGSEMCELALRCADDDIVWLILSTNNCIGDKFPAVVIIHNFPLLLLLLKIIYIPSLDWFVVNCRRCFYAPSNNWGYGLVLYACVIEAKLPLLASANWVRFNHCFVFLANADAPNDWLPLLLYLWMIEITILYHFLKKYIRLSFNLWIFYWKI